jgi:hypothetical protein
MLVSAGLSDGEIVVTAGAPLLSPGQPVKLLGEVPPLVVPAEHGSG